MPCIMYTGALVTIMHREIDMYAFGSNHKFIHREIDQFGCNQHSTTNKTYQIRIIG